ncbi:hypothetical protein Y032_0055g2562 [Ancylostoma ceylanicum]|uniref:Uncharacterized protein n=1 Tax=Ancylostoma ceylanicum TaxID=53326 RepID=A0A016U6I7_9BILA|nr:hypothetical protein Y032_0055g2562 [Ancylostoma ceylanicum]
MEEEAAEAAESGGEGGGSEGSATASKWWIIAVVAALAVLAAVAIEIPVLMKRSDGEVTNKLRSVTASMGHDGDLDRDFLTLEEFDEDYRGQLYKGRPCGNLLVEIPKDCGTPMTMKLRRSFLLAHNRWRSQTARGNYRIVFTDGFFRRSILPKAARMLVLVSFTPI